MTEVTPPLDSLSQKQYFLVVFAQEILSEDTTICR